MTSPVTSGGTSPVTSPVTSGGTSPAISAVTGALRYEWVRLRTIRSTWWLVALSLVLQGLLSFAFAKEVAGERPLSAQDVALVLTGGAGGPALVFPALFMGLFGVFAFGHEYRHGVIRATLTALPRRGGVLAAKAVAVTVFAACVAVLGLVVSWVVGRITLGSQGSQLVPTTGPLERVLLGYVAFVALSALVGMTLAGLFRNVPAALVVLIVFPLLVEPIIIVLLFFDFAESVRPVWKFLPYTAGQRMMDVTAILPPGVLDSRLRPLSGGLTFAAYAGVLTAVTGAFFYRRDA